ncbi:tRNA-dihydrouridine(20) synthase [NAD(P)+]-like [Glycine soja]
MEYRNKLVLAPMVRIGTLPFRLLAAQYGADITYCEEIIDHKMLKCERRINELIGSTDFVEKGTNNVVFRTCDEEKDRVVFQIGTSDAVRALTTAQLVCNDVAAVDINMGCPKSFSVSGGMGAALLSKPELIHDILTTLKRNLNTPVTCKIRLLKSPHDTVELARRIEKTGVSALAVHGRKVPDRPRDPAKWNEIADVVSALSIPVIANGDVFENDDVERIKSATGMIGYTRRLCLSKSCLGSSLHIILLPVEPLKNNGYKSNTEGTELIFTGFFFIIFVPLCIRNPAFLGRGLSTLSCGLPGASSVMVARGALWNASMFSPEGKVSYEAVKREYIRKCILWDNDIKSTKHTLKEMIIHYSCLELPEGKAVIKSESMADLADFTLCIICKQITESMLPSSFGDYLIMGLHPSMTVMVSLLASLPVLT